MTSREYQAHICRSIYIPAMARGVHASYRAVPSMSEQEHERDHAHDHDHDYEASDRNIDVEIVPAITSEQAPSSSAGAIA